VKRDPQEARSGESAASVAGSTAQQAFTAERQVVLGLLDQPDDASGSHPTAIPTARRSHLPACWRLVMTKSLRIAAFVIAETLAAGVPLVEALGIRLKVDARALSQPDEIFFDLMRGRLR
jgi:ParB family transcriptional regulator, chromosome partitioning protein